MESLRAAYSSAVFSYKGLLTWMEPRNYFGMKFIVPLLQMAFFAYVAKNAGGDQAMSYAVVGNMVQLCAITSVLGMSMAVGMERYFGTLPLLISRVILCCSALWSGFFAGQLFIVGVDLFDYLLCPFWVWIVNWQFILIHERGGLCGQCILFCIINHLRRELSCIRTTCSFAMGFKSASPNVWY